MATTSKPSPLDRETTSYLDSLYFKAFEKPTALPTELAAFYTPASLGCAQRYLEADFSEFTRTYGLNAGNSKSMSLSLNQYEQYLNALKSRANLFNLNGRCDAFDRKISKTTKRDPETFDPVVYQAKAFARIDANYNEKLDAILNDSSLSESEKDEAINNLDEVYDYFTDEFSNLKSELSNSDVRNYLDQLVEAVVQSRQIYKMDCSGITIKSPSPLTDSYCE